MINIEKYKELLNMLNSPDNENVQVGLTIIEQDIRPENRLFLLLLMKESRLVSQTWKDSAPLSYELYFAFKNKFSSTIDTPAKLTYRQLLESPNINKDELLVYVDRVNEAMRKEILNITSMHITDIKTVVSW